MAVAPVGPIWLVAYEPELRQRRLGHLQGVSNGVGTGVRDGQPTQLLPTSSIALGGGLEFAHHLVHDGCEVRLCVRAEPGASG